MFWGRLIFPPNIVTRFESFWEAKNAPNPQFLIESVSKDCKEDSFVNPISLTLCSSSWTFGTSARLPDATFGTSTFAMHSELDPIVLH